MFESGGDNAKTFYYNNVCFGKQEACVGTDDYNALGTSLSKNAWTNHLVTSFSRSDYVSLSETDAIAPRRGDGSMPARFARLIPGSNLVDAGCDVPSSVTPNLAQLEADFPFLRSTVYGTVRDLGPYELVQEDSTPTATQQITAPDSKGSIAVLPGNNASEAVVRFSVPRDLKRAELTVFDLAGRVICRLPLAGLTEGMDYYQPISLGALRGMAIVRISADGFSLSAKLLR